MLTRVAFAAALGRVITLPDATQGIGGWEGPLQGEPVVIGPPLPPDADIYLNTVTDASPKVRATARQYACRHHLQLQLPSRTWLPATGDGGKSLRAGRGLLEPSD